VYSVGKVQPSFEGVNGTALVVDGAELGGSAIDGDVGGFVERAEEAGRAVGGFDQLIEVVGFAHAETAGAVALAEEVPDPVSARILRCPLAHRLAGVHWLSILASELTDTFIHGVETKR